MKTPVAREDNAPRLMLTAEVVRLVVPQGELPIVTNTVVGACDG